MPQLLGETLLTVNELSKTVGNTDLLKDMTFTVHRNARVGIVGRNGCGKSTFLRILAGEDKEHGGEVRLAPNIRVGHVAQEAELDNSKTVRENIMTGLVHVQKLLDDYNQVSEDLGTETDADQMDRLMSKMGRLQEDIDRLGAWELDHQVEVAMEALRVPAAEGGVEKLSGGERRRVALCRELVSQPDLLLLDEPTNHLDAATVEWLELFLENYAGTVIMVTHDRYFLDNVTNYIVELDGGGIQIFEGCYTDYLAHKDLLLSQKYKQEERRQQLIKRELDWLNSTPAARLRKSKARIKNYEKLVEDGPPERPGGVQLVIPTGPRLGNRVLEISDLSKRFGDKVLFDGFSFKLEPGEILGVTGPNGVGKTTLFRMILGVEKPDGGNIEMGSSVVPTYVDQSRDELAPEKTVYETISEGRDVIQVGEQEYHIREYLAGFQFKGGAQQTPVGHLSGGERNRLLLAKTLRRGANLLLLDEPTNDLDLTTLRVLEEALESFAGSAVVVSHDRFFLDRIVNSLLVFEENQAPRWIPGNFESYYDIRRRECEESGINQGKLRRTSYRRMAHQ